MKRKRLLIIRETRQLATMVSPVRHEILRRLSAIGPCTVREIAESLARSPESLYYHLRALREAELIVEIDSEASESTRR